MKRTRSPKAVLNSPLFSPFSFFFPSFFHSGSERGDEGNQNGLEALVHAVDHADPVRDDGNDRGRKQRKNDSKRLHVPLDFINSVKDELDSADNFGLAACRPVWSALTDRLRESAAMAAKIAELEAQLKAAEEERRSMMQQTFASVLERGGDVRHVFGVEEDFYNFLYDIVKEDIPGQGDGNVFSPPKEGTHRRARAVALPPKEVFGAFLRRLCCFEEFAKIADSLQKDESWVRKLFYAVLSSFAKDDSKLSERFLRPESPAETWKFCQKERPDVVEFLRAHIPNFDPSKVYYVLLIDGVHFEALEVHDFFLHSLTRSEKKQSCTLLSIVCGTHTDQACFVTDVFGGKTSEPMIVASSRLLEKVVDFALKNGADDVVFFADKGFSCVANFASRTDHCYAFLPFRKKGSNQLSTEQANDVRSIAWIRQLIEYVFGAEKRLCKIVARGNLRLGAKFEHLKEHGKRLRQLVQVSFAVQNAAAEWRRGKRGCGPIERIDSVSSFLPSVYTVGDVAGPVRTPLSGSTRMILNDVPQLSKSMIEEMFQGHFRDWRLERPISATNLLAKASKLLVGHHVLGVRLKKDFSSIWGVFVIIASYRRGVYHTCLRLSRVNGSIVDDYCSCFVGNGQCIHKASGICFFARWQNVPISEFRGQDGLRLFSSNSIDIRSRDEIRDKLSYPLLCEFYQNEPVCAAVHPRQLEETSFADVVSKVKDLRKFRFRKKGNRGESTLGDRLEAMKIAQLQEIGIEHGVDWTRAREVAAAANERTNKDWHIECVLQAIAAGNGEEAEEALFVLEVLNVCPCDNEADLDASEQGLLQMIKCGACRQWWHPKCAQHMARVPLKQCPNCRDELNAQKRQLNDGTLGFFTNDHSDLHKLKYKP